MRRLIVILLIFSLANPVFCGEKKKFTVETVKEIIKQVSKKKHPYLLFTDWKKTPGYRYRNEKPYGGHLSWLFYLPIEASRNKNSLAAALYYYVKGDKKYIPHIKKSLLQIRVPVIRSAWNNARFCGVALIDYSLKYDWIQPLLTPEEDKKIKENLARYADALYKAYPHQGNTHDRIMAASGLGAISLALAGYNPPTSSKPVDWLKDGTISLFIKDRYKFPSAYTKDERYKDFCPAVCGVCNQGGFCRVGGYRAYWLSTMCKWLLIYYKATGRNPLDDFPIARGIVNEVLWESMPNGMDSEQNTRDGTYWWHFKFLTAMHTPSERGGFKWYSTDPKVDKARWRKGWAWLGSVYGLCCYEKYLPTEPPFWTSFYSPKNEAFVFRKNWKVDGDWLYLKVFNQPITSHRDMVHHDNMSFELYSRGDYLLCDSGEVRGRMYGYGPEYALGHNTILINGRGPVKERVSVEYYKFVNPAYFVTASLEKWLEFCQAKMRITHVEVDPIKLVVRKPDGKEYTAEPLPSPVDWYRTIIYPGKEYFILIDEIKSNQKYDYSQLFHFSSLNIIPTKSRKEPGYVLGDLIIKGERINWEKDVRTDILTGDKPYRKVKEFSDIQSVIWKTKNLQGKKVELLLFFSPKSKKLVVGRIWGRIPQTWERPTGSGEVDHPMVKVKEKSDKVTRITAILTRYIEEEKKKVKEVDVKGGNGIKVEYGNVEDFVAAGEGKLEYGNVRTDAEIFFVRKENDKISTLLLIKGKELFYKGENIISLSEKIPHVAIYYPKDMVVLHFHTEKDTEAKIRCNLPVKKVLYKKLDNEWNWINGVEGKHKEKEIKYKKEGKYVKFTIPAGISRVKLILEKS